MTQTDSTPSAKRWHGSRMWAFLVAQVSLFLAVNAMHVDLWPLAEGDAPWAIAVAPIIVLVLNGLLPSGAKATVLFWRLHNPLPGCRAFSHHGPGDLRVDMQAIAAAWGPLPTDPVDQNRLWYRIYKSVESRQSVLDAHSSYLLARDIAVAALLALIVFAPVTLAVSGWNLGSVIYASFMALQYMLIMVAGRNYGNRFVCNVLAEAGALPAK